MEKWNRSYKKMRSMFVRRCHIQNNDYKLIVVLIVGYKLVPNCVKLKFKLFSFEFLYFGLIWKT